MKLIRLIFVAFLFAPLAPTGANALSCTPMNAAEHISRSIERGRTPVAILGIPIDRTSENRRSVLDLSAPKGEPEPEQATYRIVARDLATGEPIARVINVRFTNHCSGPWCGSLPGTFEARLFIVHDVEGILQGVTGPCGGSVHPVPTRKQQIALKQCLTDKKCGAGFIAFSAEKSRKGRRR